MVKLRAGGSVYHVQEGVHVSVSLDPTDEIAVSFDTELPQQEVEATGFRPGHDELFEAFSNDSTEFSEVDILSMVIVTAFLRCVADKDVRQVMGTLRSGSPHGVMIPLSPEDLDAVMEGLNE
jgi:hypothetical protein